MILDRYEEAIQGRVNTHLDVLERASRNDGHARDLFTPRVRSLLSDLSVLVQCENQLIPFAPWVSTSYHEIKKCVEDLEWEYHKGVYFLPILRGIIMTNSSKTPEHHSDRKFGYSIERRRSDETTVTLQTAERALDRFWHKVDDLTSSRQVYLPEALIRLLQSNRVVQCNPDLAEPLKRESDSSSRACQTNVALLVSETYYELQYRTEQTIGPSRQQTPKHKLKTRGITNLQSDSTVELEDLSKLNLQAEQHPKFHVDGRALTVFRAMFFQPSCTAQPGEVPWAEFLRAMQSIGFACEKLYGSVWQFTPSTLKVRGGIQFHEPHPIGKIPFRIARSMGRRLTRAYGWEGDDFCLQSV